MQENQLQTVPARKEWEPMRLTPVGNLGAVMQGANGSVPDTGGGGLRPG